MGRAEDLQRLRDLERLEALEHEESQAAKADEAPVSTALQDGAKNVSDAFTYQQRKAVSPIFAKALSQMTGKPEAALLGAPGQEALPSEIMKRAGVGIPRGGSVADAMGYGGQAAMNLMGSPTLGNAARAWAESKNKENPWWNLNAGQVGDTVIDTVTDPLTYEAGILSKAAKAGKFAGPGIMKFAGRAAQAVVNPFETYNNASATRNYEAAFDKLDRAARLNDKPIMPSAIAKNEGFMGTMRGAETMLRDFGDRAGRKLGLLTDEMGNRGVNVNLPNEVAPHIFADGDKILSSSITPEQQGRGRGLLNRAYETIFQGDDYKGNIPIAKARETKAFVNQQLAKGGAFPTLGDSDKMAELMSLSNGLTRGEEAAIARQAPDLSDDFLQAKKEYSSASPLISDKAEMVGNQVAERRNPFVPTQVDAMLAGSGFLAHEPGAIGALAAKKGLNFITSTPGRTVRGRVARDLGRAGSYGLIDSAIRKSPWTLDYINGEQ